MANRRITDRFYAVKLTVKAKQPISGRPIKSNKKKLTYFNDSKWATDGSTVEIQVTLLDKLKAQNYFEKILEAFSALVPNWSKQKN